MFSANEPASQKFRVKTIDTLLIALDYGEIM